MAAEADAGMRNERRTATVAHAKPQGRQERHGFARAAKGNGLSLKGSDSRAQAGGLGQGSGHPIPKPPP